MTTISDNWDTPGKLLISITINEAISMNAFVGMTDAMLIAGGVVYANEDGNIACPLFIEVVSIQCRVTIRP